MTRKFVPQEPEKVHRLTLAELAAHDDVCSDVMVDNAYFKSRIRKNRGKHIPIRGIKEDDIPKILLHKVICDKDPVAAEKTILKLSGVKRYRSSLRSKPERQQFVQHLRKYILMYMTDCPWEVSTTNRYTITTYEAAVTARRRIKQGEVIKYLIGTLVPLTTEESADLDLTNRNFSIVVSSRKKNSSIFLGPARFANHDCDANGRLVTKGNEGMEVIAMKNIEIGDEITVSYGDDYFGPGNMDCLCHTCEVLERNGWTSAAPLASVDGSSTPEPQSQSLAATQARKRKYESDGTPQASNQRSAKRPKPLASPSKLQQSWTPPFSSDSETVPENKTIEMLQAADLERTASSEDGLTLSPPKSPILSDADSSGTNDTITVMHSTSIIKSLKERRHSSTGIRTRRSQKQDKMPARLLGNIASQKALPLSPVSLTPPSQDPVDDGSPENATMPSKDGEQVTVKIENVEVSKLENDDSFAVESSVVQSASAKSNANPPQQSLEEDLGMSSKHVGEVVATLSTTKISTSTVHTQTSPAESVIVPSIEPVTTSVTTSKMMVHHLPEFIRVPGDYVLTRKLLAQPHDRWVRCHNDKCYGFFIQPNGYQTRRECPRCERHSMLYGFPFPKTDPDPRKLLERKKEQAAQGKKGNPVPVASAYRRQGRSGKGTWVEGGGDEEERVMDHRIIHRFVLPEEERELTRKGLLTEAEKLRERGQEILALLDKRRARGTGTESIVRDVSESGSVTLEEARRRSNRFVPNRVYANVY